MSDLEKRTLVELRKMAKELGIHFRFEEKGID